MSLKVVNKLIDKLRVLYNDIQIVYGTRINSDGSDKLELNVLLIHTDEEKLTVSNKELEEMEVKNNEIYEQNMKIYKDEIELLYNVAIYCVNNPITVNGIQNEFGIGFNKTINILDRLEKLEIISIKLGTKPRKILITDEEEIKKTIYTIK